VAEPTVRVLKLLRDELDVLHGNLLPELVARLEERGDVRVQTASGTNFTCLDFNLRDPVVGKLPVRRAIAHAVDRDAIIRHVLGRAARQSRLSPCGGR
jgi:peptide/nickel transport system substrate-binding protein